MIQHITSLGLRLYAVCFVVVCQVTQIGYKQGRPKIVGLLCSQLPTNEYFFLNTEQIYMTSCVLFSSLYKLNSINSWFVLSVYDIYVCRFSIRANVLIKRGSQTLSAVVSISISVVPITCQNFCMASLKFYGLQKWLLPALLNSTDQLKVNSNGGIFEKLIPRYRLVLFRQHLNSVSTRNIFASFSSCLSSS